MREGLYAIVGSAGVGSDATPYRLGDAAPAAVVMPETESEVCALLEYAQGMRAPCIVAGSGTHLTGLTPHNKAWWLLCTRRLNRVIDYSPDDLTLTVGAGTTLHAVQALLREHNQYLPWNPALPAEATIGGIVASNRAGSWRYRHGTPRDRLLSVRAVRPDGVAFKTGAKVVKSVAGYDLHRLLCGSWGTLAVITEITLKVQPLPLQFDAVGWFSTWQELEPTLAALMRMPIQPDGISIAALRGGSARGLSGLRAVSEVDWGQITSCLRQPPSAWRFVAQRMLLVDAPTTERVGAPPRSTQLEPEPQLQSLTDTGAPMPYILLEFSGRPEGVAWQIQQIRAQGYPAEPVSAAQLAQLRDWLAPRAHALMLQILLRPSEVAEAMAHWAALQGVSVLAHAGNGILYVAVDEGGLSEAIPQRVRILQAKYRVLNGADWLRAHTGGELPRLQLSEGERRLMQRLKHALDARNLLPALV